MGKIRAFLFGCFMWIFILGMTVLISTIASYQIGAAVADLIRQRYLD